MCRVAVVLLLIVTSVSWLPGATADDQPTEVARRAAAEICHEALLPPRGAQGRPLPLASHWNPAPQADPAWVWRLRGGSRAPALGGVRTGSPPSNNKYKNIPIKCVIFPRPQPISLQRRAIAAS